MHKISKLVCFAAPLNTRQAYDRLSGHKSFYSVAGRAARANFDALVACGVNVFGSFNCDDLGSHLTKQLSQQIRILHKTNKKKHF